MQDHITRAHSLHMYYTLPPPPRVKQFNAVFEFFSCFIIINNNNNKKSLFTFYAK